MFCNLLHTYTVIQVVMIIFTIYMFSLSSCWWPWSAVINFHYHLSLSPKTADNLTSFAERVWKVGAPRPLLFINYNNIVPVRNLNVPFWYYHAATVDSSSSFVFFFYFSTSFLIGQSLAVCCSFRKVVVAPRFSLYHVIINQRPRYATVSHRGKTTARRGCKITGYQRHTSRASWFGQGDTGKCDFDFGNNLFFIALFSLICFEHILFLFFFWLIIHFYSSV